MVSKDYKAWALNSLKGRWATNIGAWLLYGFIAAVASAVSMIPSIANLVKVVNKLNGLSQTSSKEAVLEVLIEYLTTMTKMSTTSVLVVYVVLGLFMLGLYNLSLRTARGMDISVGMLFSGVKYFFKVIGLLIVMGFFIGLWSMLFVVPGIIAALRYSMAFFVLADDPSKGIMQCIDESKRMMEGNKWQLVCIFFSFIGWIFLGTLAIYTIIGIVAYMAVLVYLEVTLACFYLNISNAAGINGYSNYNQGGMNYNPSAGMPMNNGMNYNPGAPVNNGSSFDPQTGAPINNGGNYDPQTGMPLNK